MSLPIAYELQWKKVETHRGEMEQHLDQVIRMITSHPRWAKG